MSKERVTMLVPPGAFGLIVADIFRPDSTCVSRVSKPSGRIRPDPAVSGEMPVFREQIADSGRKREQEVPSLSANTTTLSS